MVEQTSNSFDEIVMPPSVRLMVESAQHNRGYTLTPFQCKEAVNYMLGMLNDMLVLTDNAGKVVYELALYEEKYGALDYVTIMEGEDTLDSIDMDSFQETAVEKETSTDETGRLPTYGD